MESYLVLYCSDNQDVANSIAQVAKEEGFPCELFPLDKAQKPLDITLLLNKSIDPVFVLISDNFLKSESCMEPALKIVLELNRVDRLIPVIASGKYKNQETNEYTYTDTAFDRVSNVIQYMNYWQEKYLELRKEKRTSGSEDELKYNEKLKLIRTISSDIGELLRLLRAIEFVHYDQAAANDYAWLRSKLHGKEGILPQHITGNAYEHATAEVHSVNGKNHDVQETIAPVREEIPPVIEQPAPVIEKEAEEEPPVDLNAIPGMQFIPSNPTFEHPESEKTEPKFLEHYLEDIKKTNPEPEDTLPEKNKVKSDLNQLVNDIVAEEEEDELERATAGIPNDESYHTLESIFNDEKEVANTQPGENFGKEITNLSSLLQDVDDDEEEEEDEFPLDEVEEEPFEEDEIVREVNRYLDELEATGIPENPEESTTDVEHFIHAATNLIESGDTEKALDMIKGVVDQYPRNPSYRFLYAKWLAQKANNLHAATDQLEIILEFDRQNVDAYYLLADLAELHKDYLLAQNYFEKVASLDPAFPGIYHKLGMLTSHHFKGQKKKAAKYFKKALQYDEKNAETHFQYANILLEHLGKYNKALKHFDRALELDPDNPRALFNLAVLYYELNDKAKASEYYQSAIRLNPTYKTEANEEIFHYIAPPVEETPAPELEAAPVEIPAPQLYPEDNGIIALITGATSGIGQETARLLASHGYRLILTGRRGDRLEEFDKQLKEDFHANTVLLEYDVRSSAAVENALHSLDDAWKNVDILINNAGLAKGFDPIHEGKLEDWDTMIDTNIKGLLYMTRAISPFMVARKTGHIINICSIAGKEVYPNGNVYCATKYAVDALTKAMRLDLYKYNIRVSQISPGHVEATEFALVRFDGNAEKAKIYQDFTPLNAADIADAIYYILCRPQHVNIQDITLYSTQQASATLVDRSGRKDESI